MCIRGLSLVAASVFLLPLSSRACDPCSVQSAYERARPKEGSFHTGVIEQFSVQGRVQKDGQRLFPNGDQELRSSQTQLIGAYDLSDQYSLQLSLPYITRRYKRILGEDVDRGVETGIGDMSLILRGERKIFEDQDSGVSFHALAGIKFPTGDSDRLGEEASEAETQERVHFKHGDEDQGIPSAVHGHDLALGSGSYDFPLGIGLDASHGGTFLRTKAHYTVRTEGDFDYRYANDFIWGASLGRVLSAGHDNSLSFALNLSGEYKPEDKIAGEQATDTLLRAVYWGPEMAFTAIESLNGFFAMDFPIDIDTTGTQTIMSRRFRGGVIYRF